MAKEIERGLKLGVEADSYEDYYNKMWSSNTTQDPNQVNLETDIVVQEVKELYEERSQVGIKKYGTTLEYSKQDLSEFVKHLQEELMDATLYLQKIKHLIK
jgi:hypothetical protein